MAAGLFYVYTDPGTVDETEFTLSPSTFTVTKTSTTTKTRIKTSFSGNC